MFLWHIIPQSTALVLCRPSFAAVRIGNVQFDGQMSRADSTIGAQDVPEKLLTNARADILYTNGDFSAGLRFEMYQNPLLGFNADYKGQGIANYFVRYNGRRLTVTAGNYYEQFGSGMILRTYEDRYLGLDNSLLGLNLTFRPWQGVTIKALAGRQRIFWDYGEGIVRGIDGEVNFNSIIKAMQDSKFREGGDFPYAYNLLLNMGGENHEGYIGLQDHGDDVWYRNIRIKLLD